MRFMIQRTLLAVAAAAAVMVTGCSDAGSPVETATAPVGPAFAQASSTELASSADLDIIARFRTRPSITIAWAKKWIGPAGGRLEFQGFAVDVPAGAVDRVTQFSIRLPVDPNGSERVVAEFGPHGETFAVPVTIELPYVGTSIEGDGGIPTVLWWNAEIDDWYDMSGLLTLDGARVATQTTHFSLYGTTSLSSGGVTTSGGRGEVY